MSSVEKMGRVVVNRVDKIVEGGCGTIDFVDKVVGKVVESGCGIVGNLFGSTKNHVRFSAKSCSVEKFYRWISTFGSVRFTPVFIRSLGSFPHFPHSLLLLLII